MSRDPFPANDYDARVERARLAIRILIAGALLIGVGLATLLYARLADATTTVKRDMRERYQFQLVNPCPSNGAPRGPCPGFEIDHKVPLCAGGRDHRGNMQWLTVEEHRRKSRAENERCRQEDAPK